MAVEVNTYTDPGVYLKEVIVPGALNVSTLPVLPTIIAHGSRTRQQVNEAVTRGLVEAEAKTMLDVSGAVTSITAVGAAPNLGIQTLTATSGTITNAAIGSSITVADATDPLNNGVFPIVAVPSSSTVAYYNPAGVVQAGAAGTYSILPHAALTNRSNRKVTNTTMKADGVAVADQYVSYASAMLESATLVADVDMTTNNAICLQLDGLPAMTITFVDSGGATDPVVTQVGGTEFNVDHKQDGVVTDFDEVDLAECINAVMASSLTDALGYASSLYGAIANSTKTNYLTIVSPLSTPASDVRVFDAIAASATSGIWATSPDDANAVVQVSRTVFDSSATYTADYINIDDYIDTLTQASPRTFTRVGAFPGVSTYVKDVSYLVDASSDLDWSNATATGVITNATQNGVAGSGVTTYNLLTNETIRMSMDGLPLVDLLTVNDANAVLGYDSGLTAAAVAPDELAININALLANNAAYGARYNAVADTVVVGSNTVLRLTSPNDSTTSSITIDHPTTLDAATEIFGIASTVRLTATGTGTRPTSGSVYYASYDYTRPDADYNSARQFFTPDSAFAFTGPLSASNPLAVGAELAFKNGAPSVLLIQVDDATSAGSPTRLEYQSALSEAENKSTATDLCVLSTDLATQVDLFQHVENESSIVNKNYRRAWYGMARDTAIGDVDTPDSYVYRAKLTLQTTGDSPGRGRHILVSSPGVEGISKTIGLADGSTTTLTLDSSYLALAICSKMASFNGPAQTLVKKTIAGFDIGNIGTDNPDFTPWVRAERAQLASNGVTVVTYDAGRLILLDPITTERGGQALISFEQISASVQKDNISRKVQQALDALVGIVPADLADFVIDIKLVIRNVLMGEIGTGAIGAFQTDSGATREIDLNRDIVVAQNANDPTKFDFKFFFYLRYPALRLFGEYSVDNPFFISVA